MAATTTIRQTPKLRARVSVLAKQTGRSAYGLIVLAIEADAEIEITGEVYRAEDVHAARVRVSERQACRGSKQCRHGDYLCNRS